MLKQTSPAKWAALLTLIIVLIIGPITGVNSADYLHQQLERAYFLAAHGLVDLAAGRFEDVAKGEPTSVEALVFTGISLKVSGQDQKALAYWQAADKLGDPAAATFIGDYYYEQGDFDTAEAAYRRALERQPDAARPTIGLALIAEKRGDPEQAIALFESIINSEKARLPIEEVFYHLGRLYLQVNRIQEAVDLLQVAVRYYPFNADMYLLLGKGYEAKGSKAESIHAYERALQLDVTLTEADAGLKRVRQ
ncbi:MAG TPA: tetratricopeptide repeat protein [Firmicutes bacterium]|nr:tetratricopeptide repeat protein [Bacillota bacterium]